MRNQILEDLFVLIERIVASLRRAVLIDALVGMTLKTLNRYSSNK